jgi:ppGpp synthetase/RelA/SpoT-type nucleotidyltranferase
VIIPAQLSQKHNHDKPYLEAVQNRVRDRLVQYCSQKGYAFIGRLKDTESLFEKIETGRFAKWSQLDDLYGCAIVVPFLDDEEPVIDWLRQQFEIVDTRLRGTTLKDPAVFRFDATRVIGKLRASDFANETPLSAISFEVQVRTAFEHAWSVATHSLAYKGERVDWGRMRLAAQLKASVEQLDMLVLGFEGAADAIHKQRWPEVATRARIEEVFRSRFEACTLPDEIKPVSWMRFCENLQRLILSTTANPGQGFAAQKFVEGRLSVIEAALDKVKLDYPRSLSLLQFCIGVLAEADVINGPLKKYTPYVSDELRSLYPKTRVLGTSFDFEDVA